MGEQWGVGYYSRHQLILFVGEGNFAFSSLIATVLGSARNIVATTVDSYATFYAKYGLVGLAAVQNLQQLGARVWFEIDVSATNTDLHTMSKKFDRIVFNYPHAGYIARSGNVGNYYDSSRHQELVSNFFASMCGLLARRGGEIHLTHKKTVHKRWFFNMHARTYGLNFKRYAAFFPTLLPGYIPCRGAGKKWDSTFPLGESRTYVYTLS